MVVYKFVQDPDGRWYVDLPDFPGTRGELEMVCGADTFLSTLSEGENNVHLLISLENYTGSSELKLSRLGKEEGGGYYLLSDYIGIPMELEMWLCEVVEYIFGFIPASIYFSKA